LAPNSLQDVAREVGQAILSGTRPLRVRKIAIVTQWIGFRRHDEPPGSPTKKPNQPTPLFPEPPRTRVGDGNTDDVSSNKQAAATSILASMISIHITQVGGS